MERIERAPSVIFGKLGLEIEPLLCRARQTVGAVERPGIVLAAVDAVGIAGDGMDLRM